MHLELLRPLEITKGGFEHISLHLTYSYCLYKWLFPNAGWRETKTLQGGSHCFIYSTFSSGWGKWQVSNEQLTKNFAVIWGVFMWTFRPICHYRLQHHSSYENCGVWDAFCCIQNGSCIQSVHLELLDSIPCHCWRWVSRGCGLLAGNGSCTTTKLLKNKK